MEEFIEKLIGRLEKYESENYKIYLEHNLNTDLGRAFGAKEIIKIVKQLAEEYKQCTLCYLQSPCEYQNENVIVPNNNGWIPYATDTELPTNVQKVWLSFTTEYTSFVKSAFWIYDHFEWENGKKVKNFPSAWKPYKIPEPYKLKNEDNN